MIVSHAREVKGITVLEDGTRVYKNYVRYKPVPLEQRKYRVLKPDDPGAVLWGSVWFLPLVVLPDEQRVMPETRPDTDAYDHMGRWRPCKCEPCLRPTALKWQKKWRKERGIPEKRRRRS